MRFAKSTRIRSKMSNFPPVFEEFMKRNEIDPSIYLKSGSKYFFKSSECCFEDESLRSAEVCDLVPGFWRIPSDFRFSTSKAFQEGHILPMDISSGLAVHLLNLKASDHVLDLCCAPGGKLVLASLLMGKTFNYEDLGANGTITGNDISTHRLFTCRSLIKKYKVPRIRLFCQDGRLFSDKVKTFSSISLSQVHGGCKPIYESTDFRKRPTIQSDQLYDKVLVDAQCTHDGSVKHIRKHMETNWDGFDLKQFEEAELCSLYDLQLSLLENGFKLLKPGGIIIYSTCSLSRDQNEAIVAKFISRQGESVKPLPFDGSNLLAELRFEPPEHDSGFFIFRATKVDDNK